MRINIDWLRDWVDLDLDPIQLAELLTTSGLEVDAVLPAAGAFTDVVVAEITGCAPHPDADRLRVCDVNDGRTTVRVVCGAPNARSGLKTAFARVGAVLPGSHPIEAAAIRGVASNGMLCSARELGISDDGTGILELPAEAKPGLDLRTYLKLDDEILDIDLTPNRGDCFSVLGIAREIAAARGIPLRQATVEPVAPTTTDRFSVRLEAPDGCPRFIGRVIRNVTAAETPLWLVERLRRAGLRAIHPVVDVTNYVMLELGQPLHSYDLRKLRGEINVRYGRSGERIALLDGRVVELGDDVVAITDRSGPIGLAGIMGGESTAVEADSVDVFLEAAYFPPEAILGRARRFGLHTDASMRFERGVDPEQQGRAIERATALLLEITGGDAGPVTETSARDHLPRHDGIALRGDRVAALLGHTVPPETIERCLESLGMNLTAEGANGWRVLPPSYRFDVTIEADLIEEIARLIGYDNIPTVPEFTASKLGTAREDRLDEERIVDLLVARGYSESISYSFTDPALAEIVNPNAQHERLINPISSDLAVMRRSLWPGLLATAIRNLSRQQERLRLFELGTQFETGTEGTSERAVLAGLVCGSRWPEQWDMDGSEADIFDVKQDVEAIVSLSGRGPELKLSSAEHPALRPGRSARIWLGEDRVGWLGELHPAAQRKLDIKSTPILFSLALENITVARLPSYRSYSKFPSIRRDLSFVVAQDVSAEKILKEVGSVAGDHLQNIVIFDLYRGPGIDSSRKSIGLGLILQDTYRTLTDEDADRTVAAVVEHLGSELGATIRN